MVDKYAIVRVGGKQYLVEEGKEVLVDKIVANEPEIEVLMTIQDGKVSLGKPVLKDIKLKVKVVSKEEKGEKIRVVKYKAKSRYRKTTGFRPQYTRLLVEKID